ncbi:MAG TPA: ABC transporter ATP-binding protein [Candidatus Lokiarchaeia archaeon]|nr:ABC transporter ATP-binding protein [Candidatus Lokiarchaeia archaeon]
MPKVRMLRYTKPYMAMILLSIGLLFVQATYCDLALPDYLSDIVNVGIQQNGVPNAAPVAMNATEMNHTLTFMTAENQSIVLGNYTLVKNDKSDPGYAGNITLYPALVNTSIYVLNPLNSTDTDFLSNVMAGPILVASFIEAADANQSLMLSLLGNFSVEAGVPIKQIEMILTLNHWDLFGLLQSELTLDQRVQLTGSITGRLNALGPSLVVQAAATPIRNMYQQLGMDVNQLQINYMMQIGLIMMLLTLASVACSIIVGYLASKTATGMCRDMRRDTFARVEKFSSTEFDSFSTASLITRSTNDVTQIQMAIIMIIRLVFYAPIIGVGGIIRALGKAPSMWWIIGLAIAVLLTIIVTVFSIALPKFQSIQRLVDRLNLVGRESLTGMMVVRAFNQQQFEEDRFNGANKDLTRVSLFINRIMIIMMPVMMMIMNGVTITVLWFGSHAVANGQIQVGDMIAFMQYTIQIVFAFLMMSLMFLILPRASVANHRIAQVLQTDPVIQDPESPKHFPEPFNGTIEFQNVSFRYPGGLEDALHDISFVAHPGVTTAFIGATGAGKSTVVNLIPRFYDVTSGSVLVDDVDVREIPQHELRDKIGYVPQKSALFSGTIASNLLFAKDTATEEELQTAIQIAQATEFVTSKPEGMDAEISQGGMNVSGGQKQRLSIARAIVKAPPIYLLDDSFSALDFKTDANLRKAFKEQAAGSTLIIVTQRVSTIKDADQIIVLDQGNIVGKGTHGELMETCEIYRGIALSQMTLEESAA